REVRHQDRRYSARCRSRHTGTLETFVCVVRCRRIDLNTRSEKVYGFLPIVRERTHHVQVRAPGRSTDLEPGLRLAAGQVCLVREVCCAIEVVAAVARRVYHEHTFRFGVL